MGLAEPPAESVTTVRGRVVRITWRAPDGDFAVVRLRSDGQEALVTALGPLGELQEGEPVRLDGEWERHAVHGAQFRARVVVPEVPRTLDGVQRYLEGMPGLGPALAARLTAQFGVDAIEVLEKEPWRAAQVKGVGKRRASAVSSALMHRAVERETLVFLHGLGLTGALARRIRKRLGDQAIVLVRSNPYRLTTEVHGIGFATADRIARSLGVALDSPLRLEAGLLHVLEQVTEQGHTIADRGTLVAQASETLGCLVAQAEAALDSAIAAGTLILEGREVSLPWLHHAECALAARLLALVEASASKGPGAAGGGAPGRGPTTSPASSSLSEEQAGAVALCAQSAVLVITGGPGTGKTTVVRTIVGQWERARRRVLLAAPTGRAAKRLSEATGRPAQTVHRLLEWGRGAGGAAGPFGRHCGHPLDCDLLVVDEASMLDVPLCRALVDAVPRGATLCFVGDVDQLPSVGPGRVLGDLIDAGRIPVQRLHRIFRQAAESDIVANAYRILAGELPEGAARSASGAPDRDFFIVPCEEPERVRDLVLRLCQERIPRAFGLDPVRDIQVLSPMHRGSAGTEELNRVLQASLNPRCRGDAAVLDGDRRLAVGDKVMQVRNDYDRDVFNGDVGVIIEVPHVDDPETGQPTLVIDFDGRRVELGPEEWGSVELAYAVTVHKSQGAEYPAVVIPLVPAHWLLLRRDLLYTAVTRGKRVVVLVGSRRALARAVQTVDAGSRATTLARRLAQPPSLLEGRGVT